MTHTARSCYGLPMEYSAVYITTTSKRKLLWLWMVTLVLSITLTVRSMIRFFWDGDETLLHYRQKHRIAFGLWVRLVVFCWKYRLRTAMRMLPVLNRVE